MTDRSVSALYAGRSTNWLVIWLSIGLMLPLVVMGGAPEGAWMSSGFVVPLAGIASVALVHVLTASSVRATAGTHGVRVHFGVFGWPRFRYSINRIRHAEAIEIPPSRLAWGIWWSRRFGLMLTLRSGPALCLTLATGRKVTISTPHPDVAVKAIDAAR
ncbi:hypothetical protein ABZW18_25185 [Streptomyces sp. NPDC004647]|uniref:hypothetical protein n=1 Tax=Streptomyces sp. NPDC004647 TaxID=3154671 RepID=UPI00339EBC16